VNTLEDHQQATLDAMKERYKMGGNLPKFKARTLELKMKRPGLKQLIGENPLSDEEFNELEKYFRLKMTR